MPTAFENQAPRLIADLVSDLKLTPEQAAGIVGNLAAESGLLAVQEKHPSSGRGGWGYAQWTGDRRVAFEHWASTKGFALDSYAANYGFLLKELLTTHKHSLQQLRKTTTAKAAAQTFGYWFERFAGYENLNSSNYRTRIRLAEKALALYKAKQPTPQPTPTPVPTPEPPVPVQPPPSPLPDPKPAVESKTLITIATTLVVSMLAKWAAANNVILPVGWENFVTEAILAAGLVVAGLFHKFSNAPVTGSSLAKAVEEAKDQQNAPVQAPQAIPEAWSRMDEPVTLQHVTDHQEVVRLAMGLPWGEFAALAIKLLPLLTAAKETAQKIIEQKPPPPPPPPVDPLDILKQT